MSLLREIQAAASDSGYPIQDLLKKCLILAARLDHAPLREWATKELNGYSSDEDLPRYRQLHVADARATVIVGNQYATNVSIARNAIPESLRDDFYSPGFPDPIAAAEELTSSEDEVGLMVEGGLANHIVQRMYGTDLAGCTSMRRIVGKSQLVALVDTIRTRILEFALEIEKLNPEAGDVPSGAAPLPTDQVQQVYNTTILGGAANVAFGSSGTSQISIHVPRGDWESLKSVLDELGVPEGEIDDLRTALTDDEEDREPKSLGVRTRGWLGRISEKAATGAIQLGTTEGLKAITRAVIQYVGETACSSLSPALL